MKALGKRGASQAELLVCVKGSQMPHTALQKNGRGAGVQVCRRGVPIAQKGASLATTSQHVLTPWTGHGERQSDLR